MKLFLLSILTCIASRFTENYFIIGLLMNLSFSLMCLFAYTQIDYKQIRLKTLAFSFFLFNGFNDLFNSINCITKFPEHPFFVAECIIFILIFSHIIFKGYQYESDIYNNDGVYVVFKKPTSYTDFIITCLLFPVSSTSIIVDGDWYGYRRGCSFKMLPYIKSKDNIYIKLNINKHQVYSRLNSMIGAKWKPWGNCCHAVNNAIGCPFNPLFVLFPSMLYSQIVRYYRNGK